MEYFCAHAFKILIRLTGASKKDFSISAIIILEIYNNLKMLGFDPYIL